MYGEVKIQNDNDRDSRKVNSGDSDVKDSPHQSVGRREKDTGVENELRGVECAIENHVSHKPLFPPLHSTFRVKARFQETFRPHQR